MTMEVGDSLKEEPDPDGYARDTHIQKRQDNPIDWMQPMELKTLPPPNNNQENENILRNRREIRSNTPIPQQPVQTPSTRQQPQH